MDQQSAINIAKKYKEAVVNAIGPATVYLFGSYSKGCARPDSDIDIGVAAQEYPTAGTGPLFSNSRRRLDDRM